MAFTEGRAACLDLDAGLTARRSEETNVASCLARRSRDFLDAEGLGGAIAFFIIAYRLRPAPAEPEEIQH